MTLRESNDSPLRKHLSEGTIPLDMIAVGIVVAVIVACYYLTTSTSVRFLVSVPLLLFLPGYVLVGILFPRGSQPSEDRPETEETNHGWRWVPIVGRSDRVTTAERLALSFGLSVAIVPLVGFPLEALPVEAFDGSIFPTLVGGVLIGALVASIRRARTPVDERFQVPIASVRTAVLAPFSGGMSWGERFVTIALAASVLLAVVSVGYVFAVPQPGERFTDLRVMTESTGDGLTLGNYPDEIVVGEASGVTVGIDNREGRTQQYTVVITAEQLIQDGDSVTAIDSAEIDRFETTLEDGQRLLQPQTITPQSSGEIRINYYLYKGSAPEDPTVENAYRHVHFTTSAVNGGTTTGEDTTPDNGELEIDGSIDAAAAETEVIDGEPPALRPDR